MMKKSGKKIAIAALGCAMVALTTGFALTAMPLSKTAVAGDDAVYAETTVAERYTVGDTVKLPLSYFDEAHTVLATTYVTYPNGVCERTDKVSCNQSGTYKVEYKAERDGRSYYAEQTFTVYQSLYTSDKKSNVVQYQADREFAKIEYQKDENGNTDGTVTVVETTQVGGLYVPLTSGSTFTYNKVFDISDKTKNDIVFSCNIVASEDGYCDFLQLTVRFTDVYDASNYVDVVLWHNYTATPGADQREGEDAHEYDVRKDRDNYLRAGASNQPVSGNDNGTIWKNGRYGMRTKISMMNCPAYNDRATDTFDIRFDYAEKAVYGPERSGNQAIIDLDNPEHFTDLWSGFTTGECTVSMFASNFQKSSGAVFIQSIFDDGAAEFATNYLTDTTAPTLDVDFNGADENDLPFGVVGTAYPIFTATASDLSGYVTPVATDVYYNYKSPKPIKTTVKNGTFTPTYTGVYTIVYTVRDAFGNEAKKTVDVNCVAANANVFTVQTTDATTVTADTGRPLSVSPVTVSGNSGAYRLTITAQNGDSRYEINENTLAFIPMESGTYTIVYTAEDFLGRTATASYDVTVTNANEPIFLAEAVLPKYFLAGYTHTLPALSAVDFSDSAKALATKIYVREDGGERVALNGNEYTPTKKKGDYTVTVIYEAVGANGTAQKEYTVRCHVDVSKGGSKAEKKELFVYDDNVTAAYADVSGTTTKYAGYTTGRATTLEYVNVIPAHNFSAAMYVMEGKNNFNKLSLTLTDAVYGNAIKVTFEKYTATQIYFSINDGTKYSIDNYSFNNATSALNMQFDNLLRMVYTDNKNVGFSVTTDLDGNAFEGFKSGKIYLQVAFEEVSGESGIIVKEVYGQQLTSSTRDGIPPLLVLNGEYRSNVSINKPLTVYSAVCLDMIDPNVKATLTLKSPSGACVIAADGTTLQNVPIDVAYAITPTEYGKYTLTYEIEGYNAQTFTFTVVDESAPEIRVQSVLQSEYKVGDKITVSATATDNLTENVQVYVCVNNAAGETEYVANGEYTFRKAGKYKVTFFAMDERGNYSSTSYTITVKE